MTNFPNSVDTFVNPTQFDQAGSVTVPHATQHTNLNDAMAAVQAFLLSGTGAAGDTFRIKSGYLWLKDTSGGGTPWHKIYLAQEGDSWVIVIGDPEA